ncbi:MAG TPA: amidohydrolase family protein [Phycisphaerae bacterium]|nr:amidohydrolase family protein [Phycisphaerae bacterium]
MIVDCHTHVWESNTRFGGDALATLDAAMLADASRHIEAVDPVDRAIVLAFKSRYLDAEIPNRFVADYVQRHADKLVGFAGIDPTEPSCLDELAQAQDELRLKGVTISPALQDFHPADTRACAVYEACAQRGLPVVFQQNHRHPAAKMEFARPLLLDEVAVQHPELKIVVAHMGFPWVQETIALLGKHRNVFADVSGLLPRRWLTYNALMWAYECGVMEKLLFGSDFPYRSPAACIEALYSINQLSQGTNLMAIPREQLRGIVERDSLSLLGIEVRPAPRARATAIVDVE